MTQFRSLLCAVLLCLHTLAGAHGDHGAQPHAVVDTALLAPLAGDDPDARVEAIGKIGALATPAAAAILQAMQNESLYATPDGKVLIVDGEHISDAATGAAASLPEGADAIVINNRLRSVLQTALAAFDLLSKDSAVRLAAARGLQTQGVEAAQLPLLHAAQARETDPVVKDILNLLVASASLHEADPAVRKAAAISLGTSSNAAVRPLLQQMVAE